jgi:hypothetical protein
MPAQIVPCACGISQGWNSAGRFVMVRQAGASQSLQAKQRRIVGSRSDGRPISWTRWKRTSSHHRPILAHGSRATALWVGGAGQALAEHTIRQTIIGRTQAVLGVSISPHLFRDCAATTLAIEDPAHVGAATTILGHASGRTTHKHYIQANTLAASRRHLSALAAQRRLARNATVGNRDAGAAVSRRGSLKAGAYRDVP